VGGAGERRADLVMGGVPEDRRDVRIRSDDPDLVRVGTERAREVDLVEADDPDRAGRGGGRLPRGRDVGPAAGEQQEPVACDLAEPPRGS
jgi:hypothetical protein